MPRWRNGRPAYRQAGAEDLKILYFLNMFFVYAIRSLVHNYIYVGLTNNIERRVGQHQSGHEKTTKYYRPFQLIYVEKYSTRILAREKEKFLKSGVGKEFLKQL